MTIGLNYERHGDLDKGASVEYWRQKTTWTRFTGKGRKGIRDVNIGNSFKEFCCYRAKTKRDFVWRSVVQRCK